MCSDPSDPGCVEAVLVERYSGGLLVHCVDGWDDGVGGRPHELIVEECPQVMFMGPIEEPKVPEQ